MAQLQSWSLQETTKSVQTWLTQLAESKHARSKYLKYIAIAAGCLTLRYLWWKIYRRFAGLPPGPLGLPFVGAFGSFVSSQKLFLYQMGSRYGAVAYVSFFVTNNLFVSDQKVLQQLYKKQAVINRAKPTNTSRANSNTAGFMLINGEPWKRKRKYASTTIFNLTKTSFVLERIKACLDDYLIPIIEEHIAGKQPFFPLQYMTYMSFNNIWTAVFDIVMPFDDPFIDRYTETLAEVVKNFGVVFIFQLVFGHTIKLPSWMMERISWRLDRKMDEVLLGWLNKSGEFVIDCKKNIIRRNKPKKDKIATQVYIDYLIERHKEKAITVEEIVADVHTMLLGAIDTTSNTSEQCLLLLAKHPAIQEKVYNELMAVMEKNKMDEFDFSIINELHIFRAFIHEVLRVSCVAPTGIQHMTYKACIVELADGTKFNVPKHTHVHSNNWFMLKHVDWNNGNVLEKENNDIHLEYWLNAESQKFETNERFLLFGTGKRDCVGRSLAMKALYAIFGLLMTRYKFVAPNHDADAMQIKQEIVFVVQVNPKIGVLIEKRS